MISPDLPARLRARAGEAWTIAESWGMRTLKAIERAVGIDEPRLIDVAGDCGNLAAHYANLALDLEAAAEELERTEQHGCQALEAHEAARLSADNTRLRGELAEATHALELLTKADEAAVYLFHQLEASDRALADCRAALASARGVMAVSLDALESDADLSLRRETFSLIQDQFDGVHFEDYFEQGQETREKLARALPTPPVSDAPLAGTPILGSTTEGRDDPTTWPVEPTWLISDAPECCEWRQNKYGEWLTACGYGVSVFGAGGSASPHQACLYCKRSVRAVPDAEPGEKGGKS